MEKTFELKAFKFPNAPYFHTVEIRYRLIVTDDLGLTTTTEHHIKDVRPIPPDLYALFDKELRDICGEIIKGTVAPFGIVLSGRDSKAAASISGLVKTELGLVKFKTPRVRYAGGADVYGVRISAFIEKLIKEVNAYLFENKVGTLEEF